MGLAKRAVGALYSVTAKRLYEPIVVRGAFPLFGGALHAHVRAHGAAATSSARNAAILDMPVGTAFFTVEMARRHAGVVIGADIAEGMVRAAARSARIHGASNLLLVQADAHHLPFRSAGFGSVVTSNGLQVIPGLHRAVAELARVLAPGGELYCSVVTLPIGRALPRRAARHLPTALRSGADVVGAFGRAGLEVTSVTRDRLATLIQAHRPD